ncbi:MAG: dethiobiotin synthetase [Cyclobacteriaceae bacterium]|jgi:dethiobiotin synthetase
MNFFVTAIGTDSGKTLVSTILTEMLGADYWKPVQAGIPTDTDIVRSLISNKKSQFHSERYLLKMPASPHASARAEGIEINIDQFEIPKSDRAIIIEGAGGIFVPLNDQHFVIDLIQKFGCEIVVVSNLYLGSINHTLLTAEALKTRNIPVKGVIFNGEHNAESEQIILAKTGWRELLHIEKEEIINKAVILKYAKLLKKNWK